MELCRRAGHYPFAEELSSHATVIIARLQKYTSRVKYPPEWEQHQIKMVIKTFVEPL
ncbi:MAG: hypothetical protein IPM69_19620 [Ignavibacteria bacterium]|nr:hypothetical protein [Ignavibacteria bacterium]